MPYLDLQLKPERNLGVSTYTLIQFNGALTMDQGFALFMPVGYEGSFLDYSESGLVNLVVVPEPGSLALLGLGGLMMLRRRRRA